MEAPALLMNIGYGTTEDQPKSKSVTLQSKLSTKKKKSCENVDSATVSSKLKSLRTIKKSSLNLNTSLNTGYKNSRNEISQDDEFSPIVEPVFSGNSFVESNVHPYIVSNLNHSFGITQMTEVQRLSIPELLDGHDALIRSQTGSGKTLAYAIPIVQKLQMIRPKISRTEGTRALIVLPTRELAVQTYECFVKLVKSFAWIVPGILVGGEKRKSEKARLRKGITIMVGTPGRILDHIEHTESISLKNVSWFILDEADLLLNLGYEKDITRLTNIVDGQRDESSERKQTVLLSATLTPQVERLAGLTLSNPKPINVADEDQPVDVLVIPQTLKQEYIESPVRLRLVILISLLAHFIKEEGCEKILIFMATQDMVDFHTSMLTEVVPDLASFFKLHGSMTQLDRTEVFKKFRTSDSGVLICTDVASRGLDLPHVNSIIQYTVPFSPADYVHRVGRTARVGNAGSAVLVFAPQETPFLEMLTNKRIKVKDKQLGTVLESLFSLDVGEKKPKDIEDAASLLQLKLEKAVTDDDELHRLASAGYKSFIRFYATYPKDAKTVFNLKNLHLGHYAKSFALREAPSEIKTFGKSKFKKQKSEKSSKKSQMKCFSGEFKKSRNESYSEYDSGLAPRKK